MRWLRRLMERWEHNKRMQTRHYIRMEMLLADILETLKGGVKDGNKRRT